MNLNNNKLKNILAMVVALALVALPNLVAVADSTEGVQGTPTPTYTSESVDPTPSGSPTLEASDLPNETTTPVDTGAISNETPSVSPSETPANFDLDASPSETPANFDLDASPSTTPPVGIPEASPSETPTADTPEATPSQTPATDAPEVTPSAPPTTDAPEATPSTPPTTDAPETTPSEVPTESPVVSPSDSPPSEPPEASPTNTQEATNTPEPTEAPPVDSVQRRPQIQTSTVQFSNNPNQGNAHDGYGLGLSHYTYEVKVNGTYQAPVTVSPSGPSDSKTITFPVGTVIRIRAYSRSGYTFSQWWRDTDNHTSSNPFVYTVPINAFNVQALFFGATPTASPTPTPTTPPSITGTLTIYKEDSRGNSLTGAIFTLVKNGTTTQIQPTSVSGKTYIWADLPEGDYTLTETLAPSGYEIDGTGVYPIHIGPQASDASAAERHPRPTSPANWDVTKTIKNDKIHTGSIKVFKKDQNNVAIYGATFTLTPVGGGSAITLTETSVGIHKAGGLTPGFYTLTETVVPNGYTGVASQQVEISSDKEKRVIVINTKQPSGSIEVTKKDFKTNALLAGATFTLTPVGAGAAITLTETSPGVHTAKNLTPGSYTLAETVVPNGYTGATSRQVTITDDEKATVTVYNNPILRGSLTVKKVDADGGGPLTGATFTLVKSGTSTNISPTSTNGNTYVWEDLLEGDYTLTETSAPSGYKVQGTGAYQITISSANLDITKTVENDRILGSLKVLKKDSVSGELLDGATFKLVKDSDPSTTIAGNDNGSGTFTWSNLVPGEYTLTETSAPNGYYVSSASQSVTISAGAEKELTVTNDPYGSLTVLKKDSVSGELLDGATFKLVKDSDPSTAIAGNDDGNGTFTWSKLLPGDYTLTEEGVPTGYYVDSSSQSVTLTQGEDKELTVTNDPYGSLTVLKKDSVSGELLDGATFKLVKDSDPNTAISGSDDGNGTFTWTDLLPGDYTLTEESVPTGYYVDSSSQSVTLTQGEDKELTVTNDPYGSLTVLKKDSVSGELLDGATFKLVKDSDPSTAIAGNDDGNGTFTWTDLLPGDYTLTEESVPTGYYDSNYSARINLTKGEDRELTVNNEKFVSITVLKRSAVTQLPLAGAVFSIEAVGSDENVRVQNVASISVSGGVLGTVTTGSDGTATFAYPAFQLRAGVNYLIKEVTPPYGYLNDSTPVYATVDTPGGTNEEPALFENNPDYGTVVVAKFQAGSNNQVRLGGVRFSLYRDSVSPSNLISTQYTDASGNIVWNNQFTGNFVLVEEATIPGYSLPTDPTTSFTLLPGERKVIILQNVGGPTPTPTPTPPPPANPPESTPTATPSSTPVPTATPTPINTDEFIIDDVAPAFGPETGEGDFLFILMGILALVGGALLIIRKKLVLKQ